MCTFLTSAAFLASRKSSGFIRRTHKMFPRLCALRSPAAQHPSEQKNRGSPQTQQPASGMDSGIMRIWIPAAALSVSLEAALMPSVYDDSLEKTPGPRQAILDKEWQDYRESPSSLQQTLTSLIASSIGLLFLKSRIFDSDDHMRSRFATSCTDIVSSTAPGRLWRIRYTRQNI
ncbi:hypothetical protein EYF80_044401 [Liparis tanakae]|uniref:Uncharacterized protein n=1 Tax=Liparis tanakae TaxID=230148 RepID=A0A4Z2FXZ9_9TELE|nr:hypothetical protein EYF80_044401 [Liparis tanakae]